jgi:hypothetical protein
MLRKTFKPGVEVLEARDVPTVYGAYLQGWVGQIENYYNQAQAWLRQTQNDFVNAYYNPYSAQARGALNYDIQVDEAYYQYLGQQTNQFDNVSNAWMGQGLTNYAENNWELAAQNALQAQVNYLYNYTVLYYNAAVQDRLI